MEEDSDKFYSHIYSRCCCNRYSIPWLFQGLIPGSILWNGGAWALLANNEANLGKCQDYWMNIKGQFSHCVLVTQECFSRSSPCLKMPYMGRLEENVETKYHKSSKFRYFLFFEGYLCEYFEMSHLSA